MIGSAASNAMWVGRARILAFWFLTLLVTFFVGVLVGTRPARADVFRVNLLEDAHDFAAGDDQCSIEPVPVGTRGNCTLRAAIEEANVNDATDTITFSSGLSGTIILTLGRLEIANDVTGADLNIAGPEESGLGVSGGNDSGVFATASSAEATIDRITIRSGSSSTESGAGIHNRGTLALTNSTVRDNTSEGTGGGGGIYNGGTLALTNSTISGNTSAGFGFGGGIVSYGVMLTLVNSTVSGNSSDLAGGGIYIGGGTLALTNSTISGNAAGNFGGGIFSTNGAVSNLSNTIVAGNTAVSDGPDANGTFTSQRNNLIGNTNGATGFGTSDLLNRNPLLGPLQSNGGPTDTRALLPDSPATDAANNERCLFADQRGVARKDGDRDGTVVCDIGAYERSDFKSPNVSSTTPGAGATGVRRGADIVATFSEKMTRSTLNKSTFKLFRVRSDGSTVQIMDVSVSSSTDRLKATLDPSNPLGTNVRYKAVVSTGARDLAGNQLDQSPTKAGKQQKTWTFKTGST